MAMPMAWTTPEPIAKNGNFARSGLVTAADSEVESTLGYAGIELSDSAASRQVFSFPSQFGVQGARSPSRAEARRGP